jgi:hypothetical protein
LNGNIKEQVGALGGLQNEGNELAIANDAEAALIEAILLHIAILVKAVQGS